MWCLFITKKVLKMYYKHLNGFSRAPGNGKSCWSVGDTKISFLNTLAENGPFKLQLDQHDGTHKNRRTFEGEANGTKYGTRAE